MDVEVSGNTVIVGTPLLDAPGSSNTGAAFIFQLTGGTWTLQAQLSPSSAQQDLESGWSVAIEGDTAVLGAPGHHVGGRIDQGSAFVFQRNGSNWTQISNLTSPNGAAGDEFGGEVAIGSGRIVVGARLADDSAGSNQGEVTVFSQAFGPWSFEQQLLASNAVALDEFGVGVSVDGETILVGAWGANPVGGDSGSGYVFTLCGGFGSWTEQALILPFDAHPGDNFGVSVGLSGSTAICGAIGFNGTGSDIGAAYIHELSRGEFTPYGFGDGGATPCPCANDSIVGLGQGCLNTTGRGAVLSAWGSDVAAADDLTFVAGNLKPSSTTLLFSGTADVIPGLPLGDGLRVVGGAIARLTVAIPDLDGTATWGPYNSAARGWSAGQTRYFQVWYRDPIGSPCASGLNLSSGLQVDFR